MSRKRFSHFRSPVGGLWWHRLCFFENNCTVK